MWIFYIGNRRGRGGLWRLKKHFAQKKGENSQKGLEIYFAQKSFLSPGMGPIWGTRAQKNFNKFPASLSPAEKKTNEGAGKNFFIVGGGGRGAFFFLFEI